MIEKGMINLVKITIEYDPSDFGTKVQLLNNFKFFFENSEHYMKIIKASET